MNLVASLLNAILRLDGDALVMHVGDKPYVVAPSGQVELATRPLALDAVSGMMAQLLPSESQRALDEFGAVQHEFPPRPEFPGERFTVVAARGGDDVWVEIRRRRPAFDEPAPQPPSAPVEVAPAAVPLASAAVEVTPAVVEVAPAAVELAPPAAVVADEPAYVETIVAAAVVLDTGTLAEPPEFVLVTESPLDEPPDRVSTGEDADSSIIDLTMEIPAPIVDAPVPQTTPTEPPLVAEQPPPVAAEPLIAAEPLVAEPPHLPEAPLVAEAPAVAEPPPVAEPPEPPEPPAVALAPPVTEAPPPAPPRPVIEPVRPLPHPAVVVPMARSVIRGEAPPPIRPAANGLDRLLRIAAARGASTLYISSQSQPSVRVDGEIQVLDEAPLSPGEVESLLIDLMPERNREALRSGISTEWICDVAEVGRVRCMTFRDHRGPGGIFRMMPVHAISADQLGLSAEIQALAAEAEGLVIVAGPRSSGKSTLVSAFVDLVNRTRRDHVITIESEIKVVHEQRSSLVSQREVRGSSEEMAAVARAALREDPDVLVFEELRSAEIIGLALEAAASGHLVLGALPAHNATGAVDRIIDSYPPEDRRRVQLELAENLRGIVAQELIRRPGGGRTAAREVLLNTRSVASVIAEGKTSQLTAAMEGGRKYGMVPQNDALVALVQSGMVDPREAYRRAADRPAFLALLKRQGVETSFVERLA